MEGKTTRRKEKKSSFSWKLVNFVKRGWEAERSTSVSLAGTSMSSPILGSVVFDKRS